MCTGGQKRKTQSLEQKKKKGRQQGCPPEKRGVFPFPSDIKWRKGKDS